MDLIVSKFGGTSVGSAESIKNLEKIVFGKKERMIIVVSALSGTTNLLIEAGKAARDGEDWKTVLETIKKKHAQVIRDLKLDLDLAPYFDQLNSFLCGIQSIGELSPRSQDYILSFGERLSSKIVEIYLGRNSEVARINAIHIVKTDSTFGAAKVDMKKTQSAINKHLKPKLRKAEKIIVTGFIGSNENGEYTTFTRGGSDYTAAIIAHALDAQELEIWTDVDGILTANPKVIPEAKVVKNISYREAAELAHFGAKVLHPKTIEPVVKKKIPVRVLNTFNPKEPGTLIADTSEHTIKSISSKNSSHVINLYSTEMLETYGFLAKVFSVFLAHEMVADVVSTSEVSVSVTVDSKPSEKFIDELKKYANVEVLSNKTIICLVGEGINRETTTLASLFSAIKKYPVRMISQGASPSNITLVVDKDDEERTIKSIYREFFKN